MSTQDDGDKESSEESNEKVLSPGSSLHRTQSESASDSSIKGTGFVLINESMSETKLTQAIRGLADGQKYALLCEPYKPGPFFLKFGQWVLQIMSVEVFA